MDEMSGKCRLANRNDLKAKRPDATLYTKKILRSLSNEDGDGDGYENYS